MVRQTATHDDESATDYANDVTKFTHAVSDAKRGFDDASAHYTPMARDFDDDGMYVGDEPAHVVVRVRRTVVADRADATALAIVDELTDRDFAVTDVNRSGFFKSGVDTSGTFDQPTAARDATHYRITVTARRRID